ncbi:MAG: ferrous iron transport protein A [Planctomycetales bacterium]|nr:ferrous iron transport protein A [Planctomycetales bacterium]
MMTSLPLLPMRLLPAGSTARVAELLGDIHQVHRLEELGLRRGTQIRMLSPGSPCIVHLEGSRLCFRDSDLLGVMVTQEDVA